MSAEPRPTPPPDRRRRGVGTSPMRSLQFKAVVGAVVLVATATGLCGWITTWLARSALTETLHRDVRMLADTTARAVAEQFARDGAAGPADEIMGMMLDERVAFIMVTDQTGHPVARRIPDSDAWHRYGTRIPVGDRVGPLNLNKVITMPRREAAPVSVFTRPIWAAGEDRDGNHLRGYLILAMSDASAARLLRTQTMAAVAVVCVIMLLCLPVIVAVIRSYTRPLRQMVARTTMLAEGRSPDPVRVAGRDEIGTLARAFNEMAGRLSTARAELIAANAELEQQVRRRTDQLHRANEQLLAQMRDKDEFIRAITHDLNAPIRNIAGMTKMLIRKYESQFTEEALTKLQRIAANARTESELLADLLELSRIRTSAARVDRVDTNELVAGIIESLAYDLEAKRIDVRVDPLPTLYSDRNRVRQVFQNLIDNAIKYMPSPEKAAERRIHIGVNDDPAWETPVFFVRDTGRGIDEKDHQRVFQVFQRARYSGETDAAGRGVGLASVKTIIETFGGQIWLDSRPGHGATFHFTLARAAFQPPRPVDGAEAAATTC